MKLLNAILRPCFIIGFYKKRLQEKLCSQINCVSRIFKRNFLNCIIADIKNI